MASTPDRALVNSTTIEFDFTVPGAVSAHVKPEVLDVLLTRNRIVIAWMGDYVVTPEIDVVVIKKLALEPTNITLPLSAGRVRPLIIKDGSLNAATYNLTIIPQGTEKIDGAGTKVLNTNGASLVLEPYPDGSGWFIIA